MIYTGTERLYLVRVKPCGCLASSNPAPEHATLDTAPRRSPAGGTVQVLPLSAAARIPEFCPAHRPRRESAEQQGGLFR